MKFKIRYGMGGGFGGCGEWEEIDAPSLEAAEQHAAQCAREIYESYEGMHGIMSLEEIMEEEGVDESEARGIYQDQIDSWIDYEAELADEP